MCEIPTPRQAIVITAGTRELGLRLALWTQANRFRWQRFGAAPLLLRDAFDSCYGDEVRPGAMYPCCVLCQPACSALVGQLTFTHNAMPSSSRGLWIIQTLHVRPARRLEPARAWKPSNLGGTVCACLRL